MCSFNSFGHNFSGLIISFFTYVVSLSPAEHKNTGLIVFSNTIQPIWPFLQCYRFLPKILEIVRMHTF